MSEYRTIQIKRMFTYDGIKKKIFEINMNSLAKDGWELFEIDLFNHQLYLKKTRSNITYEYKLIHIKNLFTLNFLPLLLKRLYKREETLTNFENTMNSLAKEGWELFKCYKWVSLFILRRPLTKEL